MLEIQDIRKHYHSGIFSKIVVKAVDGVSLSIKAGETLGLIGPSGCGKTTLARIILRLIFQDSGRIFLNGENISLYTFQQMQCLRKAMQIIFQHPDAALNPRKKIYDSLIEPFYLHSIAINKRKKIMELLELVGLNQEILGRYPHQISGGQLQRVVLARALTLEPKFLILDEPTSMLDVSVQAQVLNLLKTIQEKYQMTYLFISHDIEVVKWMSHQVAIMWEGKILELGPTEEIFNNPVHPYTKQLINTKKLSCIKGHGKNSRTLTTNTGIPQD
jgi:ABC-type oligopeptide transport system ATPase subunit